MSYTVLARKWRPRKFDDVVGQDGVTKTLRNAIGHGRIAQAFVFAGPRGVGKTTTARILARALNCEQGPTADPCGVCHQCVEISEGRDMDVLEIDAATHTQVDKVREVIISGLSIPPVRDRYKIFIIDEVHQLSGHSFNALLKSIEEPPPHVVFMMATTELQKIPETITSRSQVNEFRTISERAIAAQLRKIAAAEQIEVSDDALTLVARAADGSMRDGLTAFDQVLAFAGSTVRAEDVSSVLGMVGRDLLLEILEAVADEKAAAAFDLAGRAIESGYDLRILCRELSRLVRDLMLVSVDRGRLDDPEVAPAGERARIEALVGKFSREDLLRSFEVIARAEADLRTAAEPRYHLEMALLRWMHLRKLAPLADLIDQLRQSGSLPPAGRPSGPGGTTGGSGGGGSTVRRTFPERPSAPPAARPPVRPLGGSSVAGGAGATPAAGSSRTGGTPVAQSGVAGARGGTGVPPAAGPRKSPVSPVTRAAAAPSAPVSAAEPVFEADSDEVFDESYDAAPPRAPVPARGGDAPRPSAIGSTRGSGASASPPASASVSPAAGAGVKEAFLEEVRRTKVGFYRMTLSPAHRVEVDGDRIVFAFAPGHKLFKDQVESNRTWLEPLAARVAGQRMTVVALIAEPPAGSSAARGPSAANASEPERAKPEVSDALKAEAAADPGMQTLLELMPLEIKDIERM
jgi:DNA polymerase III subunit gamma/tau